MYQIILLFIITYEIRKKRGGKKFGIGCHYSGIEKYYKWEYNKDIKEQEVFIYEKESNQYLVGNGNNSRFIAGNVSAVYAEGKSSGDYEYQELEDAEITYYNYSVEGKELYEKEIAA